jgi:hypothetical protein
MSTLERLPKRGRNTHFNYDFIEDEDVYDAIRPALAAEGIAFFAAIRHIDIIDNKTIVYQTFTYADGKTGATWDCNWVSEAIDKQDKAIAKASTTGLKYHLLKTFILSTGDPADDTDNDGAAKAKSATKKREKPPTKSANGNDKATVGTKAWGVKAKALAEKVPYFMTSNGPNYHHMLAATLKLGFENITDSNLADIITALETHAQEAANEEAA